jgi:peptide chain release factor 1
VLPPVDDLIAQYDELTHQLGDPDVASDPKKYRQLVTQQKRLEPIAELARAALQMRDDLAEAELLAGDGSDPELAEMAAAEIAPLRAALEANAAALSLALLPRDPDDDRNCLIEIRAGTGGDEAALFVGDLFRMYNRLAERTAGWKLEVISTSTGTKGGFKDVVARISGESTFGRMKWEAGTHRVQRVPKTESQGRIHTSAVTVAVLPEVEAVEFDINMGDVRIDVFRASGPGGQSVNTTDSAVRLTHLPTGVIVICQDEKSQHKNKAKALTVLRARLYEAEQAKIHAVEAASRKVMVGSGDRSEKIRTYNYPQDRVTDHRINLTVHNLPGVLDGEVSKVIDALVRENQAKLLAAQGSGRA